MSKSNFSGGLLLCLALSKRPLVITSSILKQIEKTLYKMEDEIVYFLQNEIKDSKGCLLNKFKCIYKFSAAFAAKLRTL